MCSASTIYTSLTTAKLLPGDFAVFPGGGGGVGIQGVQLAAAMGLRPIVVDTGAEKEKLALDMGAEAFVDFKKESDAAAKVVEHCDGVGAHGVFVTAPPSYTAALGYLGMRAGAKIMCIGLPAKETVKMDIDPTALIFRNWTVSGTLVSSMSDVAKTLEFAKRGKLKLQPKIYPLKDFDKAVQALRRGEIAGRAVVDFNI